MNSISQSDNPSRIPSTGGVVLCGGKSSRMGSPKALLPFGEEVMLQRITRILQEIVEPVVVIAAENQELPELRSDVILCRDEFPDKGPLSGIYSGLKKLSQQNVDAAFVTACDCPFLKPEFVAFLSKHLDNKTDIVLLRDGKYSHVLSAIYRTNLYSVANQLLDDGQLRPIELCSHGTVCLLELEQARAVDPDLSSLLNLNSPKEYELALMRLNEQNS